jgi:undecaprenyl-diphosphatase
MITMLKIFLLGAIQGVTEFLPVSSSGHLVVAQHFLHMEKEIVFLDTVLHIGTILALLTFFFWDIMRAAKNIRMLGLIAWATLVTGSLGLAFRTPLEASFNAMTLTSACFIINGLILLLTRFFIEKEKSLGFLDAGLMGFAQALAILPSLSRSGLTIAILLGRGVKREEAFKFSFIASIPAILGAFLLEAKDSPQASAYSAPQMALGIVTAYAFGLLSLFFLKKILLKNKFHGFGYYCIFLGIALLIFTAKWSPPGL